MTEKVRPFRVGVLLEQTSEFKPLFGIGASSDGGVMVWPAKVPGQSWAFATADVPTGRFWGQRGRPREDELLLTTSPPKIHYHRSGFVSANVSGQPGRRAFRAASLSSLRGEQALFGLISHPEGMPRARVGRNDVFGVAHGSWPASFLMRLHFYARGELQPYVLNQLNGASMGMVQDEFAEVVLDLGGHGLDVVVVVRVQLESTGRLVEDRVHAVLAAFDTNALTGDGFAETVCVYTPNGTFNPIGIADPTDRPLSRWAAQPRQSLVKRERPIVDERG